MKHRKGKSPRLANAVIRGRKERYEFEVFPLDVDLQPVPAVYVISRRVIDREGRGHHRFVCIGQTESLALELKKQKKGKCIKRFKANVVSILPADSAEARFSIAADLKAAHSIPCLLEPENAAQAAATNEKKNVAPKVARKTAAAPSSIPVKHAAPKTPALKAESREKKTEAKPAARKDSNAKIEIRAKNEKTAAKTNAPILKEAGKSKAAETQPVKTVKTKSAAPKKVELSKTAKPAAPKAGVPKTKAAPQSAAVSKTNQKPEKIKPVAGEKKPSAAKSKAAAPSSPVPATKTARASKPQKTASNTELKANGKSRRTGNTPAVENKKAADSKKKAKSAATKNKNASQPDGRKRLAI